MYAKLVFRNAKRSAKDYLIYLVTMTICVMLFYSFLSISSRYYHPNIGAEYNFRILGDGMRLAVSAVTMLLVFLICYVNQYMLRRRQKEFAIQAVMGMEQKTIGLLFFAETFLMGLVSILSGIFLGVFGSQFITAMLLTSYGQSYRITWTLFPDTVFFTMGFFILSFVLTGLFNFRLLGKMKIIDMLSANRLNEPSLKRGRQMKAVVILYGLAAFWMFITGIRKMYYYFDSRFALPVHFLFWGNILIPAGILLWPGVWICRKYIVHRSGKGLGGKNGNRDRFPALVSGLLVCSVLNALISAWTPAMRNRYFLTLGNGALDEYVLFALASLLFFISAVIYLANSFLTAWKDKSPKHRYHNQNLFLWGQITTKLITTNKTMTLIGITLVLAVFLFMAAPVLAGWASGFLEVRAKYDVQMYSDYRMIYEEEDLPDEDYEFVSDFLTEHGIETDKDCTFNRYLPRREDFHNRIKMDFPVAAISLSDYNRLREMLGIEAVTLGEGEFTTQWQTIAGEEDRNDFLKAHATLMTDAGELTISGQAYYTEALGETLYNIYTDVVFVLPDSVCKKLLAVGRNRYITTKEPIAYEEALALEELFLSVYPEGAGCYSIRMGTLQKNETKAGIFVLQAVMLYGGVVLMVICLTILSLQQLLDAGDYRYRFSVLRKLGVEEKDIGCLVLKQLGIWFGLPIVTALFSSALLITCFVRTVSAEITAYIGFGTLLSQIAMTGGILAVLLICYFFSTWILFRYSIGGPGD